MIQVIGIVSDEFDLLVGEFCVVTIFAQRVQPCRNRVLFVFGRRAPLQILNPIVGLTAVAVIDFGFRFGIGYSFSEFARLCKAT